MMEFGSKKVPSLSLPSRMLIGQDVSLIDALQAVTVFILVAISSVGVQRNNTQLHVPQLKHRSLAHTSAEITWICKIFRDIGFPLSQVPTLWCDNVSAISLASNPVFHARTKHVEIDYHYIRELVLASLLKVQFVPSHNQIVDIHTKSLSKARFQFLRSKLSLGSPPFSLKGCKYTHYPQSTQQCQLESKSLTQSAIT